MIYPTKFEQKIEFTTVRNLLKELCLSTMGKEQVDAITFQTKPEVIRTLLQQTGEFRSILEGEQDFPSHYFFDVRAALARVRVEGTYLEEQELFDLMRSLETVEEVVRFLCQTSDEEEEIVTEAEQRHALYPALRTLAAEVPIFPFVVQRIHAILDKFGKVKDTASSELLRIRRELASMEGSISRTLNAILRNAQSEGVVEKDVTPTLRDGRLVIPVAPALKRRIKGIVHDESATGKTVFIEPTEVVEANNRIRELEGEERREIIRILSEVSKEIRPHSKEMLRSYGFLGAVDVIQARAHLAIQMKAIEPNIAGGPLIDWERAVHPLLQRSLEKHGKSVVPLDITLNTKKRILIISGPNAGGKSVCLKTVGLLQYMLQCGLSIPVRESSRAGVFDHLFIDIGDEQSIEDDLSTYSGHLQNMKFMIKYSNGRSLLLIDEFGGGTEPQIGGAIAEAVLKQFNLHKAFGVITTHYQNLKHFADAHEGVINGAMLYDRQQMRPLFQLQMGNPGSSFAIEIARKTGLPEEVIADASEIVGKDYILSDKYLQDIVRDKRYWESKRDTVHRQEKQMQQTIARYEQEIQDLQRERKAIIKQTKEEAQQILNASNAKIEHTIKQIKEAQAEKEKTRDARRELNDFNRELEELERKNNEDKIARKIKQLEERKLRKENRKSQKEAEQKDRQAKQAAEQKRREEAQRPIAVGDFVRIKGQSSTGKVMECNGRTAIVTFGMMKTNVEVSRLEHAAEPPKEKNAAALGTMFVSRETQDNMYEKKLQFKPDIDVRGMRGDEAINAVTYFIDDAILLGMNRVRILHGTGTGALRTLIRQYLATVGGVANFRDEHVQFGGAGITVVDLL